VWISTEPELNNHSNDSPNPQRVMTPGVGPSNPMWTVARPDTSIVRGDDAAGVQTQTMRIFGRLTGVKSETEVTRSTLASTEQVSERTNERTNGRTNERTNACNEKTRVERREGTERRDTHSHDSTTIGVRSGVWGAVR